MKKPLDLFLRTNNRMAELSNVHSSKLSVLYNLFYTRLIFSREIFQFRGPLGNSKNTIITHDESLFGGLATVTNLSITAITNINTIKIK